MTAIDDFRCDECGHNITTAHRNYHGVRYCTTCYARIFKRRLCPRCGERAKLPKDRPEAVCRRCELAKPCARCGKAIDKIGLVSDYGPVCNACAPHFREPKPCDVCGQMSQRLARVKRLGGNKKLCPRCARADFATCPACCRNRLLVESRDGRRLCRACAERDDIPCPSCGRPMPAGRGKLCEACYWAKTCQKRIELDVAAFSVVEMRNAFEKFGQWLESTVGARKAALSIHRYLSFFTRIEANWKRVPTYSALLAHFGAEGLRRVRLPMRWLQEKHGIEPDSAIRETDSERRRIEALSAAIPAGSRAAAVFAGYQKALMVKLHAGRTSLRSIRLALRPAVSVLLTADPEGNYLPDQNVLDRYLLATPGQKAAVTGFIRFLSTNGAPGLTVQVDDKKVRRARRRALKREIVQLAKHPEGGEAFLEHWIATGIAYFHGVRIGKRDLRSSVVIPDGDGLRVEVGGKAFFLPKPKVIAASHGD